jgi:hypothetical protein
MTRRGQPHRGVSGQDPARGVLQVIQRNRDAVRNHLARCVPAAVHRGLLNAVLDLCRRDEWLTPVPPAGPRARKLFHKILSKL